MAGEFRNRIGTFCLLIGLGVFVLFIASDSAGQTNFDYLFWALLAVVLGIFLRRKTEETPSSGRFSLLKRFQKEPRDRRGRR
jgi:hypothetical protein